MTAAISAAITAVALAGTALAATSWAETLADAEARYGHEKRDILVTPEKSAEMARPIIDPKAKPALDLKGKPIMPGASLVAGPPTAPRRPG